MDDRVGRVTESLVMMSDVTLRVARASDLASVRTLIEELGYSGIDGGAFAGGYAAVLEDAAQRVWLAERMDAKLAALDRPRP